MMTTIVFDTVQFGSLLSLALFVFFCWLGYHEEKPSAGAFLFVAGLMLIGMSVSAFSVIPAIIVFLVLATGIFVTLLGVNKWLIKPHLEKKEKEKEGKS
jgi:hypothetical protein